MDWPPAQDGHDPVAKPLDAQAALDHVRMIRGQLDRTWVAEEVGGMQQVDVQCVALDPFAAVEEASQAANLRVDRTPKRSSKAWTADIW